ncbi:MAG: hypothetical protein VB064_14090 [Oscillospiraceae bacterium]|nr:hypothetical protein [Oscillospiraceae bacterium]
MGGRTGPDRFGQRRERDRRLMGLMEQHPPPGGNNRVRSHVVEAAKLLNGNPVALGDLGGRTFDAHRNAGAFV